MLMPLLTFMSQWEKVICMMLLNSMKQTQGGSMAKKRWIILVPWIFILMRNKKFLKRENVLLSLTMEEGLWTIKINGFGEQVQGTLKTNPSVLIMVKGWKEKMESVQVTILRSVIK